MTFRYITNNEVEYFSYYLLKERYLYEQAYIRKKWTSTF